MASSFTPRSLRSSAISFTRATSVSSNRRSPSTSTGSNQCCSIQAESSLAPLSRVTRISSNLTAILLALSSLAAWLPRCRSGHARLAPRIVVVRAAPVLDEVAQLLVRPLRQHDAQLHVLIADLVALARRNALALEAQGGAGVGPGRDLHGDAAVHRGHRHRGAEQGLLQRDRQLDMHVVALALEEGMHLDLHLDQRVAGRPAADSRHALPLEAQRLAVLRSEEHASELQSLMRISYAVFCLKKKTQSTQTNNLL